MLNKALAFLAAAVAVIGGFWLSLRIASQAGRDAQRADSAEQGQDESIEAQRIRDRINSDLDYADSVRDRFTR